MTSTLHQKIRELLKRSEHNYYRLVLLVGETNSGKTSVLRMVAKDFETSVVNVNLELSGALLGLTAKKRSLKLQGMLHQIAVQARSLLVLDNLEILFGKELKLDPLRLLQGLSRNHAVVASWNGRFSAGRLVYAEPSHPEYQRYDTVDALIVSMEEK